MRIAPASRTPVGSPTDADRLRACERLSVLLGREIRGGWAADELAREFAACFGAGYEQARRELGTGHE